MSVIKKIFYLIVVVPFSRPRLPVRAFQQPRQREQLPPRTGHGRPEPARGRQERAIQPQRSGPGRART